MSLVNLTASLRLIRRNPDRSSNVLWLVFGLFLSVAVLELFTPSDYVFSYLYIGPVLLANLWLHRKVARILTLVAVILTLAGLWTPSMHYPLIPTLENRLIAVVALVVTEVLSSRNRYYEESLAQQQAKLQLQEKVASLREDFVSTLTHDLKTPLLGAIETLRALQREQFGPVSPAQQKVFTTMTKSHQASLQLLETLLDVYRNDAEGLQLNLAPVDLVDLSKQVVTELGDLASNYQVSVSLNFERLGEQPCWVMGDIVQLRRVLTNLFINAVNHTVIDGHVEVAVRTQLRNGGLWHLVEVMDQGPGIRLEDLNQIFERFYQGGSARQAKGSGLGLYLSRQIVESHKGTIWAHNREPQGALFGFGLPAHSVKPT